MQENNIYFWSPIMHWEKSEGRIIINEYNAPTVAVEVFPEFYFCTQNGIEIDELIDRFSNIDKKEIQEFIMFLIEKKVLIKSILNPKDLFESQTKLFQKYDENLMFDKEKLDVYTNVQLNRMFKGCKKTKIELIKPDDTVLSMFERRSQRVFDETTKISQDVFSNLFGVLQQIKNKKEVKYAYGSAGGLYPIDIFIYIKKNRVDGVRRGLYYYHPVSHSIYLVDDMALITKDVHFYNNKNIFESSAFSIFMIYNSESSMAKYGGNAYSYALIEAGIITATLTSVAEHQGIGLCSIGDLHFDKVKKNFKLQRNQVLLHVIEGGLKLEQ
ncbi:SagB/ThcOx family dehydrogenase [Bacillus thuringiensis]|uniref:SagB/ThcOx family dehydrogenase n=1 Tax=Bacillus thuringiensis TaxID=1428 RepID=UPI001E36AFA4|nr:SagB/ThcOx family dehydrogenase [Bacillus thuringiensis]MCC6082866.1 SagB/ThcOx family dehydrogenase [Bacillus thuringiensis]